ncbi:MAG: hypothetical protein JOZ70_00330 [Pseudolabrys sp.]|nr:hypothetical protein [Pseudolabrys sp.]MBV9953669.1 hypothetical protein [Pseudolabrys sp.]
MVQDTEGRAGPSVKVAAGIVVIALLAVLAYVSFAKKPDATARDPQTQQATQSPAGGDPKSEGGTNDRTNGRGR